MRVDTIVAALMLAALAASVLGASGCTSSGGGAGETSATRVPAPLDPAKDAGKAADDTNKAIKGLEGDVKGTTDGN
jgi:hypothetical protein